MPILFSVNHKWLIMYYMILCLSFTWKIAWKPCGIKKLEDVLSGKCWTTRLIMGGLVPCGNPASYSCQSHGWAVGGRRPCPPSPFPGTTWGAVGHSLEFRGTSCSPHPKEKYSAEILKIYVHVCVPPWKCDHASGSVVCVCVCVCVCVPPTGGRHAPVVCQCVFPAGRPDSRSAYSLSPLPSKSRQSCQLVEMGSNADPDALGDETSSYLKHRTHTVVS